MSSSLALREGPHFSSVRSRLKPFLPVPVQQFVTRFRNRQAQRKYARLSLPETFARIYESGAWAGSGWDDNRPYSGPGSSGRYLEDYCTMVRPQIASFREKFGAISLADLGCGDFNVGRVLAAMAATYTGVDISSAVVSANIAAHATQNVRFVCADLTTGDLPPADLAIVRQVLQHLSNAEARLALANIRKTYHTVLVTEHVFTGEGSRPNLDIHHGPRTRVPFKSGIFIDLPPFNIPSRWISDIPYAKDEVLRTWVIEKAR